MESIPKNRILEYNDDTLQYLREQYNLNTPARINEAVDILDNWIQKQSHFVKKDFSRNYLERSIIICKGSTEKAKKKMDKTCTFRTLMPAFFEIRNPRELLKDYSDVITDALLPKLTKDQYRVYLLRNIGKHFESSFSNYYKFTIMVEDSFAQDTVNVGTTAAPISTAKHCLCEYLQLNDYCNGVVVIFDYRETNILEVIKNISLMELRQALTIVIEGYSFRIKGLHFITQSKTIDAFLSLVKQALSEKLVKRIHVHKDCSTLVDHVPMEILPVEFGGTEKSLEKLHDELLDELGSNEFLDYLREVGKAKTDESKRQTGTFNEQYLGMPGSFRTLSVD